MDFKKAAKLGSFLSKDYAEDLFRLLATYTSISASEAASRLDLHIKTVQDFLDGLFELGFLRREEVYEKKRPYFRYSLIVKQIAMELDLAPLFPSAAPDKSLSVRIREKKNAGARFTTARSGQSISNIVIWTGKGRDRAERKLNLSLPQGRFLFHLPFPTAEFQSISWIMEKAGLDHNGFSEIMDIVEVLAGMGVIEQDHL